MIGKILDFFYPKKCALCGRLLEQDSLRGQQLGLCGHCDLSPYRIPFRIPFDGGEKADASEEAVACFRYEDRIRRAITRLKYEGRKSLADYFAAWMLEDEKLREWMREFDLITAVPVSDKRFRARGYNQAELLGRHLADRLSVPYGELLIRPKNTPPLKGLDKNERKKVLDRAFDIHPEAESLLARRKEAFPEKDFLKILVVDDICTTGSTLEQCVNVLESCFPWVVVRSAAFASENEDFA